MTGLSTQIASALLFIKESTVSSRKPILLTRLLLAGANEFLCKIEPFLAMI